MAARRLASCLALALAVGCATTSVVRPAPGFPEGSGSVRGIVTGRDGRAIEGAVITLEGPEKQPERGGVTGPDGAFAVASLAPGTWHLVAAASGYEDYGPVRVRVHPGESETLRIRLEPVPEPPRFRRAPDGGLVLPRRLRRLEPGWRAFTVGDVAAFAMPGSWKPVEGEERDPWVGDFEEDGLVFSYRFGYTYTPFACPAGTRCRRRAVWADGHVAQFITYVDRSRPDAPKSFAGLYVYNAGGGASLSLWAYCSSARQLKSVEEVFKSVSFP